MHGHISLFKARWAYLLGAGISLSLTGCGGGGPPSLPQNPLAAKINDTGVAVCIDRTLQNIACSEADEQLEFYGQDANYGRDAQARAGSLDKTGGGNAAFDFSKMSANGSLLEDQAQAWADSGNEASGSQWSCVIDHVTGLTWEIKSNDDTAVNHSARTFTWYNSDTNSNGGDAGVQASFNCDNEVGICNTEDYLAELNSQQLCGRANWRLPLLTELLSIADQSLTNPPLDRVYFPNASFNAHWTSQSSAADPSLAWYVYFTAAGNGNLNKSAQGHIRAVSTNE